MSSPSYLRADQRPRPSELAPPLPHNLDAERGVLGAILLDNAKLRIAAEIINSGDFFSPNGALRCSNGILFAQMLAMSDAGENIDLVTLTDFLERKHLLAHIDGGPGYIAQLMDGVPHVSNVEHYARIVKEKALLRSLIHEASSIQDMAFGEEADAASIATLKIANLGRIAVNNKEAVTNVFDTWEEFQNAKPLRSLIENFLQADVCNIVGGLSGDGKTLILFSVTKALLTGNPLFGFFKVLEPLDRVIYLIPECARAPFLHRAKLFGLADYIKNGRLLVRTITKGPRIDLDDTRLLPFVKDAAVIIDTAARFSDGDENSAGDIANGLATDIFGLITAGAAVISMAHHAPKSFEKENRITLENILRGSGDFGALVGAGFGIRQIDENQNIIHLEDIKSRDSEPVPPFQIIGRPYITDEGDFHIYRRPNECAKLEEYLEIQGRNKGGGASKTDRDARAANLALMGIWLRENPNLTSTELVRMFANQGIKVGDSAIRKYRKELRP